MERKFIGSSIKSLSLNQMAWVILILSISDAWLTDLALQTGIAYEANPLAKHLYELDERHLWFYLIKILLPLMVIFLSYRVQQRKLVLPFFWMAVISYFIILFFHVFWITIYVQILL